MKAGNNRNGFTLIELLAVIVVLAIVTVLATTTLLPLMNRAIKKSFVDEANAARETAGDIMTLMSINSFTAPTTEDGDWQISDDGSKICISIKEMVEQELYDKDIEFFEGDTPEYEGKVIITKGDKYTYRVIMHNNDYMTDTSKKVTDTDAKDYKSSTTVYSCQASDVNVS